MGDHGGRPFGHDVVVTERVLVSVWRKGAGPMGTMTQLTYHIVFATKYRQPIITDAFRPRLYGYMGGILRGKNCTTLEVGGTVDHVHILAQLPPTFALSAIMRDLKCYSSKWLNELPESDGRFEWQKGYGAFTVGNSQIPRMRTYLQNQEEHHRSKTFEEEYIQFLKQHQIEYRLEYLFDGEFRG